MITCGVTVSSDNASELSEHEHLYLNSVRKSGMVPLLLKYTSDFVEATDHIERLDALLLIGGCDVHPCHYGKFTEEGIEYMAFNRDRDLFELQLARWAWQTDLPTLGICRGSQVMNVALGGTLITDLAKHHRNHPDYHLQPEPYDRPTHEVHIQPGTRLFEVMFGDALPGYEDIDWVIDTNSMHHQACEHPAYGLFVNAVAGDGVYEGIEDPSKRFYLGVQWHPEYLSCEEPLFAALCAAAMERKDVVPSA